MPDIHWDFRDFNQSIFYAYPYLSVSGTPPGMAGVVLLLMGSRGSVSRLETWPNCSAGRASRSKKRQHSGH